MLLALQLVLLTAVVGSIAFYGFCILCTWQFFNESSDPLPSEQPGASVLVPVCGLEEGAVDNWRALCQQDYANYEVLFGVMDPLDPAVPVLKDLVEEFPERAKFVFCSQVRGVNYKISNLMGLLEEAQHELILFADSDICVQPHYLKTVTAPLANPKIGLVTCAYVSRTPKTLGAALASLGRCIDFIPSVLVARRMDGGLQFAMGATVATRRSVLKSLPEFHTLANRIGDDFHVGRMTAMAGYQVELSRYIVDINIITEPVKQCFRRELRWSRTIRCNRGNQYYGLGMTYGTLYSLLLVVVSGVQPWAIALMMLTWFCRSLQALIAIHYLNCPALKGWLWLLPLRDSLNFWLWVLGISGNRVYWRGRQLQVSPGGFIRDCNSPTLGTDSLP